MQRTPLPANQKDLRTEHTNEQADGKKWIGGSQGGPGGWEEWQNSALCVASETQVFMTLLGHNDAHCIVLHVKRTLASRPGLKSALARRPETGECFPFSPFPPFVALSISSRSSFFLRFIKHCAIKETNVNRSFFKCVDTIYSCDKKKVWNEFVGGNWAFLIVTIVLQLRSL